MPVPDLIRITREVGYHTDQIGRHEQGRFFACIVGAYLGGWRSDLSRDDLRWYAVMHHFDHDGAYLCSDIELAGINIEGGQAVAARATALLDEWLDQLDDIEYGDIAVRLFRTEYDGIVFGLVDESEEYGFDHVELYPNRVGFHEPWNGDYDT